jgi:hypothetical protein
VSLIYGLVSSEHPEDIRYIGLTSQRAKNRLMAHRSAARSELIPCETAVSIWTRDTQAAGHSVEMVILHDNLTFEEAHLLEIEAIAEFRARGVSLLNRTDGGVLAARPDGAFAR